MDKFDVGRIKFFVVDVTVDDPVNAVIEQFVEAESY